MGTCERQTCECDRAFSRELRIAKFENKNSVQQLDKDSSCRKTRAIGQASCCKGRTDLFIRYNNNQNECCATGVLAPIGLC